MVEHDTLNAQSTAGASAHSFDIASHDAHRFALLVQKIIEAYEQHERLQPFPNTQEGDV